MIGSTNHLDQLDPGIAKRPSRFDRKYFFNVPDEGEREQYAEYWRHKLRNNKKVDFPKGLSAKVASITDGFSFAYIQEAFVAALLVIAGNGVEEGKVRGSGGGDDEFEGNEFWKQLKIQVENLRKQMDDERDEESVTGGMLRGLSLESAAPSSFPRTLPTSTNEGAQSSSRGGPPFEQRREQMTGPDERGQFERNNYMPPSFAYQRMNVHRAVRDEYRDAYSTWKK